MRKVLLLGSSGEIAPNIIPALGQYYDLRLADLKPHPGGLPTQTVDITDYKQVLEAAQGVEAIANFTVNRPHPVLSFAVSTTGAFNVMKAAAEVGIKKVLHTGPELVISDYGHEFDIGEVPQRPGSGYYSLTKMLGMEICRAYARTHGIQTICYQFNGLGPKPERAVQGQDFPPFTITWEDLVQACRLALDIEVVPDDYQAFNLHSYMGQGKYNIDKARRMLGYEPSEPVERYYRRPLVRNRS